MSRRLSTSGAPAATVFPLGASALWEESFIWWPDSLGCRLRPWGWQGPGPRQRVGFNLDA